PPHPGRPLLRSHRQRRLRPDRHRTPAHRLQPQIPRTQPRSHPLFPLPPQRHRPARPHRKHRPLGRRHLPPDLQPHHQSRRPPGPQPRRRPDSPHPLVRQHIRPPLIPHPNPRSFIPSLSLALSCPTSSRPRGFATNTPWLRFSSASSFTLPGCVQALLHTHPTQKSAPTHFVALSTTQKNAPTHFVALPTTQKNAPTHLFALSTTPKNALTHFFELSTTQKNAPNPPVCVVRNSKKRSNPFFHVACILTRRSNPP